MIKTLLKSCVVLLLLCGNCYAGVDFDGTDDRIDINETNLKVLTAGSISVWVYPTTEQFSGIFIFGYSVNADDYVGISYFTGEIYWVVKHGGSNIVVAFTAEASVPINTWSHLAVTVDGNGTSLYINGNLQTPTYDAGSAASTEFFSTASLVNNLNIGSRQLSGFNNYFGGIISDVNVWSVKLTTSEVELLADSKIKGMSYQIQPSNLQGYWPLDDEEDGTSGDGDTFINRVSPGTDDGTGDDGGNNTGLTALAETVLTYP